MTQRSNASHKTNGAEKLVMDMKNTIENDIKAYLEIMNNI